MKRFLILGLVFLLLGSALFADDAKVMPGRLGRFYFAPSFSFAPGAYDSDGNYESFDDGSVKVLNMGFALEYGIIDWLTFAIQWAPGWTVWSDIEAASGFKDSNTNGVADIFLGAKFQIIGANAPVKTEMFRLAVAPGLAIPLPGPDFEEEFKNVREGKKATLGSMDKHVLGAGGRFYFDWNINKKFFINLYNETLFYPIKNDLNKHSPNLAGLKAQMLGMAAAVGPGMGIAEFLSNFPPGTTVESLMGTSIPDGYGGTIVVTPAFIESIMAAGTAEALRLAQGFVDNVKGEVDYKYRLTFEIEPVFSSMVADGIIFTAGLPVNYVFSPAYEYTVKGLAPIAAFAGQFAPNLASEKAILETARLVGNDAHILSLKPNVSLFLLKTPLPLEFKFQYNAPIYGQNVNATHTMALQVRAYFKI